MEVFIIYLLKAAALSSIFLLGYLLLLKNDTSFTFNRFFLLGGILLSFILPSLEFTRKVYVESTTTPLNFEALNIAPEVMSNSPAATDWWQISGIIYFAVMAMLLLRLFYRLINLCRLTASLKKVRQGKFIYCTSSEELQPFSFFNYIVYNPTLHSSEELEMILNHERTHSRQWHSMDVLLVNLLEIVLWFNPLNRWYKNNLIQNLEYLADKETAGKVASRKAYQKAILRTAVADFKPVLVNHFYQSFLKKRIIMLNKKSSPKPHFWKVSLVFPFIFAFLLVFNVKTEAQVLSDSADSSQVIPDLEISAVINKNSTNAHLKQVEKVFQKQNMDLSFDHLEFSEEGYLTRVSARFKKQDGTSGNINLNNSEGISPVEIYSNTHETGFRTVSNSFDPKKGFHNSGFSRLGTNPLYIIGDKKYKAEQLFGKYIQVEGEISVLSVKQAIEIYGKVARDGTVLIKNGKIISDFEGTLRKIDSDNKPVSRLFIHIEEGSAPAIIQLENNPDEEKPATKQEFKKGSGKIIPETEDIIAIQRNEDSKFRFQTAKPLVVIEGEIQARNFDLSDLEPNKIKHLNVLKGKAAIEKYGKKGENGVVEVDLKSNKEMSESKTSATTGHDKNGRVSYRVEKIQFQDNKHADKTIVKLISKDSSGPLVPLIVVGGEVKDEDFDVDSIDHNKIESINVLKGESAIEKYGEKAKAGVIEITTKE